MLAAVAAETGWSANAQVSVLLDFLTEAAGDDASLPDRLRAFLAVRMDAEGDEEVDLLAGSRIPWSARAPRRPDRPGKAR